MKHLSNWVLIIYLLIPALGVAQSAQEATGIQAASLALIDDALLQFERGNIEESVKDLGSSAAILRIEAKSYTSTDGDFMKNGAIAAEHLAASILDKSISSKEKFLSAAAVVVLNKANAHYSAASKFWGATKRIQTGEEVLALSHALKHSVQWTNGKISEKQVALFALAETTSQKLVKNEPLQDTKIKSLLSALGEELTTLNKARKSIL